MNVKTLNTTSLDGDVVIIKKGGASGGGSESGGTTPPSGGSNIEYLDLSGVGEQIRTLLGCFAPLCKINKDGDIVVGAPFSGARLFTGELSTQYTHIQAVGIDLTNRFDILMGGENMNLTMVDYTTMVGLATQADFDSIPRLTEEQFYTLE